MIVGIFANIGLWSKMIPKTVTSRWSLMGRFHVGRGFLYNVRLISMILGVLFYLHHVTCSNDVLEERVGYIHQYRKFYKSNITPKLPKQLKQRNQIQNVKILTPHLKSYKFATLDRHKEKVRSLPKRLFLRSNHSNGKIHGQHDVKSLRLENKLIQKQKLRNVGGNNHRKVLQNISNSKALLAKQRRHDNDFENIDASKNSNYAFQNFYSASVDELLRPKKPHITLKNESASDATNPYFLRDVELLLQNELEMKIQEERDKQNLFPKIQQTIENSRYKELQKIRDKINALGYASSSGNEGEDQGLKDNQNSYKHGHRDGIHRVTNHDRKRNNR